MTQKLLVTALALSLTVSACDGSSSTPKDAGDGMGMDAAGPREDAGEDPPPPVDGGGSDTGVVRMDGGGTPSGMSDSGPGGRDAGDASTTPPRDSSVPREAGPVSCARAPSWAGVKLTPVVTGLSDLVYAAQPPDSSDWYLVEQRGTVRVFSGGMLRAGNVLDVTSEVGSPANGGDERGLLGLAFPPDFQTSRLFYVMLTPRSTGLANHDLVREYRRTDSGSTLVRTLLDLPATPVNHNGGTIVFGPDGQLYIGTGDGGEGCGLNMAPQDLNSRYGKILRIDPKQANPTPSVVHYGLRNPFRFSFDRVSGDMFIGDVGQDRFEELDIAPAGSGQLNFGWPAFEANATISCSTPLRSGSMHTRPIMEFGRRNNGCTGQLCDWASIVGGVVYRGSDVPQLYGAYIFGDYTEEYLVAFYHCSPTMRSDNATVARSALNNLQIVAGFVEDNEGELYFVADRNKLMKMGL